MSVKSTVRRAQYADSWYSSSPDELSAQFGGWFAGPDLSQHPPLRRHKIRALIVPHAGYRYSGPTAAKAYSLLLDQLDAAAKVNIVLLHPSHYRAHSSLKQCPFEDVDTPFGLLAVTHIPGIGVNSTGADQGEHSAEIQFPFIKYLGLRSGTEISVTPIAVGPRWSDRELQQLKDYISSDDVFKVLVVSTDFCHFGANHSFTRLPPDYDGYRIASLGIRAMDMDGFEAIKSNSPQHFVTYLQRTKNTICGQSPMLLAMHLLHDGEWTLVDYQQSDRAVTNKDHSVSYVAAVCC